MTVNNALFLIGGTGALGQKIAQGLVTAEGYPVKKAIVRNIAKAKILQDMGWTLVELADFENAAAVDEAFVGAKTVVSTLGGADLATVELATIRAAKQAGATLFVPSQFGVDFDRWSAQRHPFLSVKQGVVTAARDANLPTLLVYNGYFADMTFDLLADPANGKGRLVGDGTAKITFTARTDIGHVLAKALSDPQLSQGGTLSMQGETMSWNEAFAILGDVLGKPMDLDVLDPQAALQLEMDDLAAGFQGDMGRFFGSFQLHLLGEPARGSTGADVSAQAKSYGVKMQSLKETLQQVYGK